MCKTSVASRNSLIINPPSTPVRTRVQPAFLNMVPVCAGRLIDELVSNPSYKTRAVGYSRTESESVRVDVRTETLDIVTMFIVKTAFYDNVFDEDR